MKELYSLKISSYFVLFSVSHSFIIGLLPFFLPVLIWQSSHSLGDLTEFISWAGAGYAFTLMIWHQLFIRGFWKVLVISSFLLGATLIYVTLFHLSTTALFALGILNGVFNCSYWMLQRVLFNTVSNNSDSGRLFGNLQLFLGFSLKVGILIGGYFMTKNPTLVFSFALIISLTFSLTAYYDDHTRNIMHRSLDGHAEMISQGDRSNINWRDKLTFIIDGPFLYLESYLWVLSIYLLTGGSTEVFSLTIITLSLTLGVIFYFIKNIIDKQRQKSIYQVTIIIYLLSWLSRGLITPQMNGFTISFSLLAIAFSTAIFRLYFNKRFYDCAKQKISYQYILRKSFYSQISICIFFSIMAFILKNQSTISLNYIYWAMAPICLFYFCYKSTTRDIIVS